MTKEDLEYLSNELYLTVKQYYLCFSRPASYAILARLSTRKLKKAGIPAMEFLSNHPKLIIGLNVKGGRFFYPKAYLLEHLNSIENVYTLIKNQGYVVQDNSKVNFLMKTDQIDTVATEKESKLSLRTELLKALKAEQGEAYMHTIGFGLNKSLSFDLMDIKNEIDQLEREGIVFKIREEGNPVVLKLNSSHYDTV